MAIQGCAVSGAWRAFWGNVGGAKAGSLFSKLKLYQLDRCVSPVVLYRVSRWPFTVGSARYLDRVQRRMIRSALRIKFLSGETELAYSRRAAHLVSNIQGERGSWSSIWAERCITWAAHLIRNRHGCSWGANILDVRSTSEVSARRMLNSNRPRTRMLSGFCSRRWTDGVSVALEFWNSLPAKSLKKYGPHHTASTYVQKRGPRIQEHVNLVQSQLHKL